MIVDFKRTLGTVELRRDDGRKEQKQKTSLGAIEESRREMVFEGDG